MISNQLLNSFKGFRFPILYDVPLIQYAVVPFDAAKEVDVLAYDVVRCDY